MSKISKYTDFLLESQLEMLLEANIQFEPKFKELLNLIDSPIKDKLISLQGKEVDSNTNYITFNKDKEDKVFFTPDDKVAKLPTIFKYNGGNLYNVLFNSVKSEGKYKVGRSGYPGNDQVIKVIKKIPLETIQNDFFNREYTDFNNWYGQGNSLSHISWEDNGEYETFCDTKCIYQDYSKIRKSDIAVGRFTRALLTKTGEEVDPKQLEDFVSKYKAAILIEREAFTRFQIVNGEKIKFWYNVENYENPIGTLGSSCMRYDKCGPFLKIYTSNPDQARLIILKGRKDPNKICARAILWLDDKGRNFMDRVYVQNHADINLFIEFAIENGFYYKKDQTYASGEPIMFNGEELSLDESVIDVTLKNGGDFNYYPYMDSLKYYTPYRNLLTSDTESTYDYELTDTEGGNGSCDSCGGSGSVECEDCGGGGERQCYRCDGDGETDCSECNGSGTENCSYCDGDGDLECSTCDGNGETDCPSCDGSGEDEEGNKCSDCNGDGKEACDDCEGSGRKECTRCEGNGTEDCSECEGNGQEECSNCDGNGETSCDECGGRGRVDCYECS